MSKCSWRRWPLVFVAALAAATTGVARNHDDQVTTAAARVKHVFIIVLENKNYSDTFGTSTQDPYLQKTLVPMGGLLTQYYGTGHVSLDNYISFLSGQAPTQDTVNDCFPSLSGGSIGNYTDVVEVGPAANDQIVAKGGCIYPKHVKTLADQMSEAGLTWKGYMGDMGNDPSRESAMCGHPQIGAGTDNTNTAEAPSTAVPLGDAYATRHNPFMYFHSIIDSPSCKTHVVNLDANLAKDLERKSATPNLVFITPNLCDDGHDGSGTGAPGTSCANGQPGGLTSIDTFLKKWVPQIMASAAYKEDGLLIITFDESSYTLSQTTNSSTGQTVVDITFPGQTCCNEQPGPNLTGERPGSITLVNTPTLQENIVVNGLGGDRIGALLLSPFVKPGSTSETQYNHYSLLRSLEDIFRLRGHLGYAADDPSIGYYLDTVGNDADIFEHEYRQSDGHFPIPRF